MKRMSLKPDVRPEKRANLNQETSVRICMSEYLTPKVLSALKVMHSDLQKWQYTREFARVSKTSKSTISDEFPKLAKLGILDQRSEGREVYYRLRLTNASPKTL